MKKTKPEIKLYSLKEKIEETSDVITFKFIPVKGDIPVFIPGQFVGVYFLDDRCGGICKFYSISNCPGEKTLDISVKKAGKFSGALHDLKLGEDVKLDGPSGFFYPDDGMDELVFLAGGIGITPFFGITKNYFNNKSDKKITLFYGVKRKSEAVFNKELKEISDKWKNLKLVYAFTRGEDRFSVKGNICEFERINVEMLKKHLGSLSKKHFFICGSIDFVGCLWKELKENGVTEDRIKVESFF